MSPMPAGVPSPGLQYPDNARLQLDARGSPAADAIPAEPTDQYAGPGATKQYFSWRSIGIGVGIAVAVVVVIGVVLFAVPFSHSFSGATDAGAIPSFTFPGGAPVKVTWQSTSGTPVTFQVVRDYDGDVLYSGTGVSGSFSFTAAWSVAYDFELADGSGSATFSGTYQAPLVTLWG